MKKPKKAFFIGRFQPFQNGHLSTIENIAKARDITEIIIGLGVAQHEPTVRDPFSTSARKEMISQSLHIKKPYQLIEIPDIDDNDRWVKHVESLTPKFEVVYSVNPLVKNLFSGAGYKVRSQPVVSDISATQVRRMMLNNQTWQKLVPVGTARVINKINGVKILRDIVCKFINPASTADVIIKKNGGVVLVKRKYGPYQGQWSLPGGFIETDQESLGETAAREVKEETGLTIKLEKLKLVGVYSQPGRDPRGHIISHVFVSLKSSGKLAAGDDAKEINIFQLNKLPKLAFDHQKILEDYYGHY